MIAQGGFPRSDPDWWISRAGKRGGMGTSEREAPRVCPVCGKGELVDLAFDGTQGEPRQTADSREVDVYSCGHEVQGPSVATADADILEVERRPSDEGVVPPDRMDPAT